MKVRRWIFLVLVGCASPLTVAEPRDGDEPGLAPDAAPPIFGEAAAGDANDEPPQLGDPVEDAGIDAGEGADFDAEAGD